MAKASRKVLAEKFPTSQDIIQHLVFAEDPQKATQLYGMQRLQLAALLISARQDTARCAKSTRVEFSVKKSELLQSVSEPANIEIGRKQLFPWDGRSFFIKLSPYTGETQIICKALRCLWVSACLAWRSRGPIKRVCFYIQTHKTYCCRAMC